MKGGVAVMLELALALAGASRERERCATDVGLLLFGREELAADRSSLAPLLARERSLREADLAIMLEPTANVVQAGCLGNLDATWTFHGRAGHSARPWLADNAIDRAVAGIAELHEVAPSQSTIDGLAYTQALSVTTLHAGVARNVIPAVCTANVNFRYAPGMSAAERRDIRARALRATRRGAGARQLARRLAAARQPADGAADRRHGRTGATQAGVDARRRIRRSGDRCGEPRPRRPRLCAPRGRARVVDALVGAYRILDSFLCA